MTRLLELLYALNIKRNIFQSVLHIPALWYFGTSVTYPPWFRRVKLVVIPLRFIKQHFLWNIAIQLAVGCYNSWANLRCSGCYPLGEKLLWNRSMGAMASQITSLIIVYSTVYSGADQRKTSKPKSLAFVRGIHWWRWIPRTKGQ